MSVVLILVLAAIAIPILNEHAQDKHAESAAIHKCLQDNGPYMTFKAKGFDSFYLLCQFQPDKWGFQICTKDGCTKSAFSPDDGSWRAVKAYLDKIATPFKGSLPWVH